MDHLRDPLDVSSSSNHYSDRADKWRVETAIRPTPIRYLSARAVMYDATNCLFSFFACPVAGCKFSSIRRQIICRRAPDSCAAVAHCRCALTSRNTARRTQICGSNTRFSRCPIRDFVLDRRTVPRLAHTPGVACTRSPSRRQRRVAPVNCARCADAADTNRRCLFAQQSNTEWVARCRNHTRS
jgi:hypothetical protein